MLASVLQPGEVITRHSVARWNAGAGGLYHLAARPGARPVGLHHDNILVASAEAATDRVTIMTFTVVHAEATIPPAGGTHRWYYVGTADFYSPVTGRMFTGHVLWLAPEPPAVEMVQPSPAWATMSADNIAALARPLVPPIDAARLQALLASGAAHFAPEWRNGQLVGVALVFDKQED